MENKLTKALLVQASQCDHTARLGIPETFSLCMDLAGEHAESLGNGVLSMMDRGLFWAAVKTRLRFYRRPALMEPVTASTWPEPPGRLRQNRDYLLTDPDGAVLAAGKTEWTVLNTRDGGLCPIRENIYPEGLEFCRDQALPEHFYRFVDKLENAPVFGEYTVRSTDIDMGRHMNNAAYARMLAGMFTTAEQERFAPTEVELHYRASAHEGDTLLLRKRENPDGALELRAELQDGTVIVLARVIHS